MNLSAQESKRELVDAEENSSNAGEDNAPQAPPPQSVEVQAPTTTSESMAGKKGKFRLILMPFRVLRKRYCTLMHIKSGKDDDDDDDTDQKPRGRVSGPVTGSGDTKPKPKPEPKPRPQPASNR